MESRAWYQPGWSNEVEQQITSYQKALIHYDGRVSFYELRVVTISLLLPPLALAGGEININSPYPSLPPQLTPPTFCNLRSSSNTSGATSLDAFLNSKPMSRKYSFGSLYRGEEQFCPYLEFTTSFLGSVDGEKVRYFNWSQLSITHLLHMCSSNSITQLIFLILGGKHPDRVPKLTFCQFFTYS